MAMRELFCFAVMTLAATAQVTPSAEPRTFRLGPDDVILVRAVDAEEISDKQIRVDAEGYINMPLVGRLHAAGLTVDELQVEMITRLKRTIRKPDVAVSLVETHSQPVSVVGAVKNPGIFQLQSRKTLIEVLSAAGGPRDDAGFVARIT